MILVEHRIDTICTMKPPLSSGAGPSLTSEALCLSPGTWTNKAKEQKGITNQLNVVVINL